MSNFQQPTTTPNLRRETHLRGAGQERGEERRSEVGKWKAAEQLRRDYQMNRTR